MLKNSPKERERIMKMTEKMFKEKLPKNQKFQIYTENGDVAYYTNVKDGDTLVCAFRMDNGKVALFWGHTSFMLYGEWTFMLTEHDGDAGIGCLRLMVTLPDENSSSRDRSAQLFKADEGRWIE